MNEQKENTLVILSILLSIALYVIISLFIAEYGRFQIPNSNIFLPDLSWAVAPEPLEKFLYILGIGSLIILPISFFSVASKFEKLFPKYFALFERPRIVLIRDASFVVGIISWLLFLAFKSELSIMRYYLIVSLIMALLFPIYLIKVQKKSILYPLLSLILMVLSAGLIFCDEKLFLTNYDVQHHFDPLIGVINQIRHGKTVLVDTTSQYGILYGYIASILLKPLEFSVKNISLFFVALFFLSQLFIYLAVSKRVSFFSILPLLFMISYTALSHSLFSYFLYDFKSCQIYYQYTPIRMIFWSFFVWFLPIYLEKKSLRLALLGYVLAGISILWNADSGVVIFVAWSAVMLLATLVGKFTKQTIYNLILHSTFAVSIFFVTIFSYLLFAKLRSGQWPDLRSFYSFQKIYYEQGFYMLPMKLWELWQPIILIYLITIFATVRNVVTGQLTPHKIWYAFIAISGVGLFSYYQGRSHIQCLYSTLYPAALLCFLLFNDLIETCKNLTFDIIIKNNATRFNFLKTTLYSIVLFIGLTHFSTAFPGALNYTKIFFEKRTQYEKLFIDLKKDIEGQEVIILLQPSNYFHLMTESYSGLPFSSPIEINQTEHVKKIQSVIDQGKVNYIVLAQTENPSWKKYLNFDGFSIFKEYEGPIFLLKRKNYSEKN